MTDAQGGAAEAFDLRAATYEAGSWHVDYARRLVELAALEPGMRVLDAATGTGFAAIPAARMVGPAGQVVGVDISVGMLDKARQSVATMGGIGEDSANVELVHGSACSLPRFGDDSFDVVLCSAGLLYMSAPDALREWVRLLRPGGLVGFSTMREGSPLTARLFRALAREYGIELHDPMSPLGTESRCASAMNDAGIVPTTLVSETVRFAREDLERAWEAHVHGPYHDQIRELSPAQSSAFRHAYAIALSELVLEDERRVLHPEVIYAFGRKPTET